MIKWYLGIVLFIGAFTAGGLLVRQWYVSGTANTVSSENSIVLAEKITKVLKLTAVEGYFSEIYDYKDYYRWDWAPFRKKVLIRANAKVSVGFDFEDSMLRVDDISQTVYLRHPGPPRILSIDHDLEYYDIQEGAFNTFSEADHSRLQRSAKNYIGVAATKNQGLFEQATEQLDDILSTLETALSVIGWQLEIIKYKPSDHQLNGPFETLAELTN